MRVISIGEILWDVLPSGEHLGGAPFNFTIQAQRLGHDVRLVSAVGDDDRGVKALDLAALLELNLDFIQRPRNVKTGVVTVSFDHQRQPRYTIHRPAAYDFVDLTEADLDRLARFDPDWIYFGTLFAMNPHARAQIGKILQALPRARRFYDVNLRPDSYTPLLVRQLLYTAHVVKLNEEESRAIEKSPADLQTACARFACDYDLDAVAITRGANGCAALVCGSYVEGAAYPVKVADPIGAGDAFAAAFLHGLGENWPAKQIADFANRAGAEAAGHAGAVGD
jgi:fructokinase